MLTGIRFDDIILDSSVNIGDKSDFIPGTSPA